MSWTLVRRKNGQEVPIKVSVLDVFRSGPKRENKTNGSSHIVRPQANTKVAVTPKAEVAAGGNKNWSTSEPEVWTEDEDKILWDLKTSDTPWKKILEALGDKHNSKSHAMARWKEIEGKAVGSAGAGDDSDKKTKKEEEKKAKAEQKRAEGLAKKAAAEEAKEGKGGKKERKGILKNNDMKSTTCQEHELKSVAAKYDRDKWLAVASRHFDRTGQRISPEMAKAMCGATD